jgi:hypothetical protein
MREEDTINGVEVNKTMEKEESEGATPLEVDQSKYKDKSWAGRDDGGGRRTGFHTRDQQPAL